MDQAIIDQKLESLRRCVLRLKERCPETPELLSEDLDAQDIVSLNLTRAIQLCHEHLDDFRDFARAFSA